MRRLLSALIVMTSSAAFAGSAGTSGASSLRLAAGARGQAMGEAFSSVANGADALYWNPAGLTDGAPRSVLAGFQPMPQSVSANQFGGAVRVGRVGMGVGYGGVTAAKLDAFDDVGNRTGSFDAKDQTFVAAAAVGGPRFSVGAAGKMWRSDIDGVTASAAMADLGASFANPFSSAVRHALVVRHIGGAVSYISQKDPLPTTAVFGTAVRLGGRFLIDADLGEERGSGAFIATGIEWRAVTSENFGLALRGGFNNRRSEAGNLAGASAGAGIAWRSLQFDYAWIPFGDLGDSQSMTIGIRFGDSSTNRATAPDGRPTLGSGASAPSSAAKTADTPPVAAAASKGKMTDRKTSRRRPHTLESIRN